ncbi:tRNA (guanine-N7-)-methyltransferase [Stella humosa]|uniref:tRNA (guanine-N(7)-)-methyltransferase n=1 Tax=Stella humosa TaxID=94 RepID=A0A3N1KZY7_9PROT|nr:tRNA (guanosine(46)-N7)-methyltransferase TrmB [Stella humosa]ROP84349.1 tRNA (guanine-N7-)-methyltransferase [Stella humosa]
MEKADLENRRILYGRRQGRRLRTGQQALLADELGRIGMERPADGQRIDPATLFPAGCRSCWLEVGFGGGEHLAWQAAHHRDVGILGAEPFINGVVSLLAHVRREGLDNVRVLPDDARALIDALPDAAIARAFVLHPDPWPKARHHKRRFVARWNLDRLARVMADGAELRLATDDVDYLEWMLEHALDHPHFEWQAKGPEAWRERAEDWPVTRYEEKAVKEGRRSWRILLRRRQRPVEG